MVKSPIYRAGMDFGFSHSYNALVRVAVDEDNLELFVYYEYYKNHMTDPETVLEIQEFRYTGELIYADSAKWFGTQPF